MKANWLLTVTALAALAAAPAAAQDIFLPEADAGIGVRAGVGGQFSLMPAGTNVLSTSGLFLEDPTARGGGAVRATGSLGGVSAVNAPGQLTVGFDYLRPFWSFRDFTLAVPKPYAPYFPVLADVGHTDNEFTFVPVIRYNVRLASLDLDVGAAATFLATTGRLQRSVALTGAVAGDLTADYGLTLISVIPVQAARRFDAAALFGDKHPDAPAGALVDVSLGARFVSLDQDYTSTLHAAGVGGVNLATRTTSQSFQGIGVTGALGCQAPMAEDLICFLGGRGSLLVGNNDRSSTATVAVSGLPGFADAIAESKSLIVPVVELEAGFEWGTDLGTRLANSEPLPVVSIRVAGIGQYWHAMGPLSAGSGQGFRTSDLYLAGVSVTLGLRH